MLYGPAVPTFLTSWRTSPLELPVLHCCQIDSPDRW